MNEKPSLWLLSYGKQQLTAKSGYIKTTGEFSNTLCDTLKKEKKQTPKNCLLKIPYQSFKSEQSVFSYFKTRFSLDNLCSPHFLNFLLTYLCVKWYCHWQCQHIQSRSWSRSISKCIVQWDIPDGVDLQLVFRLVWGSMSLDLLNIWTVSLPEWGTQHRRPEPSMGTLCWQVGHSE